MILAAEIMIAKIRVDRIPQKNQYFNMSFDFRYEYDADFFSIYNKNDEASPANKTPAFSTPWRERYEKEIPEPRPRFEREEIMEDTEPHSLLQDQANCLGAAYYPRTILRREIILQETKTVNTTYKLFKNK